MADVKLPLASQFLSHRLLGQYAVITMLKKKGVIALHPTYKVCLKWGFFFRRSAAGCWYVIIVH